MNDPSELVPVLESLYELARGVCAEVDDLQPELVVGLAHSGWMVVTAAQACWHATRQTCFPPALRTNLGQEKHEIYRAEFSSDPPAYCCDECSSGIRQAHFLAWLAGRLDWQAELESQVQAVYGSSAQPNRILVVDDVVGGGRTSLTALGLFDLIAPRAETRLVAGQQDWTNRLTTAWLERFTPVLYSDHQAEIEAQGRPARARYPVELYRVLKPLVTGTEDVDPASLSWRAVDLESPAIQAVADHLAPEAALKTIPWTSETITSYVELRARGELPCTAPLPLGEQSFNRIQRRMLEPEQKVLRQAWFPDGLTRRLAARLYGVEARSAGRALRQLVWEDELSPVGFGSRTVYVPNPESTLPEEYYKKPIELYWVFPGWLGTGQYPFQYHVDGPTQQQQVDQLLLQGITCFINLTEPGEPPWTSYTYCLADGSLPVGRAVTTFQFPSARGKIPEPSLIEQILDQMDRLREAGEVVYLHSGGGRGRAAAILGCYLVRCGFGIKEALLRLEQVWAGNGLSYRVPESEALRRLILSWPRRRLSS